MKKAEAKKLVQAYYDAGEKIAQAERDRIDIAKSLYEAFGSANLNVDGRICTPLKRENKDKETGEVTSVTFSLRGQGEKKTIDL